VGRPPDPLRREELLRGVVRYLERHGLARLSLRPLAQAIGVSPRTLLYHFGSKEALVAAALGASEALEAGVRELEADGRPVFDRLRGVWARTADPAARAYLALFFEVYAAALREPARYRDFLDGSVRPWLDRLAPLLEAAGLPADDARLTATELVALHHGAALDLLATGDEARVTAAYHARLAELEARVAR
jgi:AcrR family transcriptional regulator